MPSIWKETLFHINHYEEDLYLCPVSIKATTPHFQVYHLWPQLRFNFLLQIGLFWLTWRQILGVSVEECLYCLFIFFWQWPHVLSKQWSSDASMKHKYWKHWPHHNSYYLATKSNSIIQFHFQWHDYPCKLLNSLCRSEDIFQGILGSFVFSTLGQCLLHIMDDCCWEIIPVCSHQIFKSTFDLWVFNHRKMRDIVAERTNTPKVLCIGMLKLYRKEMPKVNSGIKQNIIFFKIGLDRQANILTNISQQDLIEQ